jgi:transcriptional/translational regulatory protein YebC/TACO1
MFKSKGIIRVPKDAMAEDPLMEIVLEAGADDMALDGEEYEITTAPDVFDAVRQALEKAKVTPASAEVTKVGENPVNCDASTASRIMKLVEALDELDDTQHVYANFDVSEAVMAELAKQES